MNQHNLKMAQLDIVELIENNPITKLSNTYQNKLLDKIKAAFTETEQQLFISSFYCYLNYHSTNDFVIDLDNIWKWLGFSQKIHAKKSLEKHFVLDLDYKSLLSQLLGQTNNSRGGHNKETILLNVKTFKLFCMKAGTKKADELHEYFVKLEEIVHETVHEECEGLKHQLENQIETAQTQQFVLREQTILDQFTSNTECVYYGCIANLSSTGEHLIKFGKSNVLRDRVKKHKATYDNFYLLHAFKVDNCVQIENAMKLHPTLQQHRRTIKIDDKNYNELISIQVLSYDQLDEIIRGLIQKIEYSPENYSRLLTENEQLKKRNLSMRQELATLKGEQRGSAQIEHENHEELLQTFQKVRRFQKARDGKYYIEGITYEKLFGTRDEVWSGIAFKTAGQLQKMHLLLSNSPTNFGKIVSRAKYNTGIQYPSNKFVKVDNAPP
jgi:hypothetical protein